MDLSIITVTYQSQDHIDKCILSVVTSAFGISCEHIVVDNRSTDGTVELIEEGYAQYVTLIKNDKNLGFAAANNRALAQAKGRYILFLNPDAQICHGTLDDLVAWMDAHPEAGASGCKLVSSLVSSSKTEGDEIPSSRFEHTHRLLRPLKFLSPLPFIPFFLNVKTYAEVLLPHFSYSSFDDDLEQEVEHVRGAFLLVRKEILEKLGFAFDPQYFLMIEDVDLCLEIKKLGYKIYYLPQVSCIDYLGQSLSKQTELWKYRQLCKSFIVYIQKWYSPFHLFWLALAIPLGFILRIPAWLKSARSDGS